MYEIMKHSSRNMAAQMQSRTLLTIRYDLFHHLYPLGQFSKKMIRKGGLWTSFSVYKDHIIVKHKRNFLALFQASSHKSRFILL